jgi:hypothetical protein
MTDYRVDYIVKPDPFGRIQALGGSHPNNWRDTEDRVIAAIGRGDTFHVIQGLYRVSVVVERGGLAGQYLKTIPDGTRIDNLLSLPNLAA